MKKIRTLFVFAAVVAFVFACKKDFLDVKPDKALLVPATLGDMRALLDNNNVFNNTPALTALADGDLVTTEAGFNGYVAGQERNSYTWAKDIFGSETTGDWNVPFQQVFYANVVLEGLNGLSPDAEPAEYAAVKGTALFHRAFAFYNLAQEFCRPYREGDAGSDPGLPLKLSSDVSARPPRAALGETYTQILADLAAARRLLPQQVAFKSRPSRAAAFALMARVCLSMERYADARKYADSCLRLSSALIDYNTLSRTATRPFPRALPGGNDEVLFYAVSLGYTYTSSSSPSFVAPALYDSYDANDLRKVLFYREFSPGNYKFKGNYAGILVLFSGLATDELYLIRAECSARAGDAAAAMADLNRLLEKRWASGTFVPLAAADGPSALDLVLCERRKELAVRGDLRWSDLRRLNADPLRRVTLQRTLDGKAYTLEPGSARYVYPIPEGEIRLNPGLTQNER